jgi:hypothetical protein
MPVDKYQVKDQGKPELSATFTVEDLPEGNNEVAVLARSRDATGVSDQKAVPFKKPPDGRLFALCVGVDKYAQPGLDLSAAVNDATAIRDALKKHCGKPLFADVKAELLPNAKATRKGVLDALSRLATRGDAGKPLKPTDLMVVFFAGHGVKEGKDFYLLTHDAVVKKGMLAKTAVSGTELQKALSAFRCQVLLLLDACHSGAAGGQINALKGYGLATDAVTRAMVDEEVGVVVLAAAQGHEHALEKGNRGFFARAVEEAISRKAGVPCNYRDKYVYVHHLYSYAFDRVKDLSNDKQHPSLNQPDTVESFPVVP